MISSFDGIPFEDGSGSGATLMNAHQAREMVQLIRAMARHVGVDVLKRIVSELELENAERSGQTASETENRSRGRTKAAREG
jgi:hypothetical protein